MSGIINLNKARKARNQSTKQADAAANRVRFGRTKAEKQQAVAEAAKLERRLDDAKRED